MSTVVYMPHHNKPIPKMRLLRIVIALAVTVVMLTLCDGAKAQHRPAPGSDPATAIAVAGMKVEISNMRQSVDRLVKQGEVTQKSRQEFYERRPVFQADLNAVVAARSELLAARKTTVDAAIKARTEAVDSSLDKHDNRIVTLEIWRWGSGGAFFVILGVLGFVIKSYRAEIKAEEKD